MNKEEIDIWLKHFADKQICYQIFDENGTRREINFFIVFIYLKGLQQKVNQLEEKEELHLNRIDELIDEIVKLKTNRNKAIKLLKRGAAFCKNDSYGGYEVCKIAIKRESKAIEILKGGSNG